MGIARLKEALETNDWAGADDDLNQEFEGLDDDEEDDEIGFGREAAQLQMEMFGMKRAIYGSNEENEGEDAGRNGDDEETSVEELETLMMRMQALRGKFISLASFLSSSN